MPDLLQILNQSFPKREIAISQKEQPTHEAHRPRFRLQPVAHPNRRGLGFFYPEPRRLSRSHLQRLALWRALLLHRRRVAHDRLRMEMHEPSVRVYGALRISLFSLAL